MVQIRPSTQDSSLNQSQNQNLANFSQDAALHNPNQGSASVKSEGGVTALYEFLVKPVLPGGLSSLNDLPQKAVHLFGEIENNPQYQKALAAAQAKQLQDAKESEKIAKLHDVSVNLGLIPQPENVLVGLSVLLDLGCGSKPELESRELVLKASEYVEQIESGATMNDHQRVMQNFDAMRVEGLLKADFLETENYERIAVAIGEMLEKLSDPRMLNRGNRKSHILAFEDLYKRFEMLCQAAEKNNKITTNIYKLWIKKEKLYSDLKDSPVEPYESLRTLYRKANKRALLDAGMYLDWMKLIRANQFIEDKDDARQIFAIAYSAYENGQLTTDILLEVTDLLWVLGEYLELIQFTRYSNNYLSSDPDFVEIRDKGFFYDEMGNKQIDKYTARQVRKLAAIDKRVKEYPELNTEDIKKVFLILNYQRRALMKRYQYIEAFRGINLEALDDLKDNPDLTEYKLKIDLRLIDDISQNKGFFRGFFNRFADQKKEFFGDLNNSNLENNLDAIVNICLHAYMKGLNTPEVNSVWILASWTVVRWRFKNSRVDANYNKRIAHQTIAIYEKLVAQAATNQNSGSKKLKLFSSAGAYQLVASSYLVLSKKEKSSAVVKEAAKNGYPVYPNEEFLTDPEFGGM